MTLISRKDFVRLSAASVLTTPWDLLPEKNPIEIRKIRIRDIKVYEFRTAVFVKIETDAGISGWGEANSANRPFVKPYIEKSLRPFVINRSPFDSELIWHDAYIREIESGIGGIHPGSLAGIDNALWDLKGRLLNLPVSFLLGGMGLEKIQVYYSRGRFINDKEGYHTAGDMARFFEEAVHRDGYKAVKVRLQVRQENVNPFPDDNLEVVRAVRKAIGDQVPLYVDFNNGYTPAEAIVLAKKMIGEAQISALEEPVFQQDYNGLRQVVDALDIPVMAGEHEYNKWMIKDLISIANVDIINTDVLVCAGITECRKAAAIAHAFGKQIMVHNARPTLATAATLQFLASIPNAARFQEYAGERKSLGQSELFHNYFRFEDGFLYLPDGPGVGLEPNEDAMEKNRIN